MRLLHSSGIFRSPRMTKSNSRWQKEERFSVKKVIFSVILLFVFLSSLVAAEDWPYILLRSNLHVHTIYSNKTSSGEKLLDADHSLADLPGETIEHAQKIGLNVLGLSDHNNVITDAQWQGILAAGERTYQSFFCLSGVEWTQGGLFTLNPKKGFLKIRKGEINHINVFGAKDFPNPDSCPDLYAFYRWLRWQPDKQNIVCQFNHPGFGSSQFDKFKFYPDLTDNFCLLEVGSGPTGFYEEIEDNLRWFNLALQKGWRVGPSIGIDNWGTIKKSDARRRHTGIWLELLDGLSQEGVLAALRARRVFASEDAEARLKFWAESRDKKIFMGDVLSAIQGDEVKFFLDLRGREKFTCELVEIKKTSAPSFKDFGASRIRLLSANFTGVNIQHAHADTVCYYLKIKQSDGDMVVSAPIWLKLKEPSGTDPGETRPALPPPTKPTPPRPQTPPVSPSKPVLTMAGLPLPVPSNWNVEILAKRGKEKSGSPSFFGEGSEVFVLEDGSQWRGETGFRGNKYLKITHWLFHLRVRGFLPPWDKVHSLKTVRYILTRKGWAMDRSHPQYPDTDFWDMRPDSFWNFWDVRTGKPNPHPIVYTSEQNNSIHSPIGSGWYALAVCIDNLPVKVVRFKLVK